MTLPPFDLCGPIGVGFSGNIMVDFTQVALMLGANVVLAGVSWSLITPSPALQINAGIVFNKYAYYLNVEGISPGSVSILLTPTYSDGTVDPRAITVNVFSAIG